MKQLQNQFTTLEQSMRLLEIGVPKDTADMYYFTHVLKYDNQIYHSPQVFDAYENGLPFDKRMPFEIIPCWSVGRLMEIFEICFKKEIFAIHVWESIEYCGFPAYTDYLVSLFVKNADNGKLNFSKLLIEENED